MNHEIHGLLQEMEDGVRGLPDTDAKGYCRFMALQLEKYMWGYEFRDAQEEILYFKVFKPRFMAFTLFYESLAAKETLWPQDLKVHEAGFCNYYNSGQTDKDHYYFNEGRCAKLDFRLDLYNYIAPLNADFDKLVARIMVKEWMPIKKQNTVLI